MPIIRPFYLPKKCALSQIIFHSVSLCGVVRGKRGGAKPLSGFRVTQLLVGKTIKSPALSLSSTTSSSSSSLSRITISREMKKFFWCERSWSGRVECVGLMPSTATLRRGFFGGRFLFFDNERFTKRSKQYCRVFFHEGNSTCPHTLERDS